MAPLKFILPIYLDNVESWRRLCQEMMGTRREQYEASRRQLGIIEEQVCLLHTEYRAIVLIALDVEKPKQFLSRLAASTHPFDLWFKRKLRQGHGIDLAQLAPETHNELLFEWRWQAHGDGD